MSDAALLTRPQTDRAFERLYTRTCTTSTGTSSPCCGTRPTRRTSRRQRSSTPSGLAARRPMLARNWLLKIAHNECRQRFRMLSRRQGVVWDERAAAPPVDDEPSQRRRDSPGARHLSFNQRSALVMRELEGARTARSARSSTFGLRGGDPDLPRTPCTARAARGGLSCGEAEPRSPSVSTGRSHPPSSVPRAHLRECE